MPKKHERNKFVIKEPRALGTRGVDEIFPKSPTLYVVKADDEVVNNSNTLQDDDELFFPVLAEEVWDVEAIIIYDAGTAADFKWDFSVPGTEVGLGVAHRLQVAAAGTGDDLIDDADTGGSGVGGLGVGTQTAMHIRILITVGAEDGNIQFRWAQNTTTANDTTVHAGSYLRAQKVS